MPTSQRTWLRFWLTVAASVLAIAVAVGPPLFYATLFLVGAGSTAALLMLSAGTHDFTTAPGTHVGPRAAIPPRGRRLVITAGLVFGAAVALLSASPWLLVLTALLATVSCPPLWTVVNSRRRDSRMPVDPVGETTPPPEGAHYPSSGNLERQVDAVYLDCLSTAELCRAWRMSFVWLQNATTTESRVRIAACRERYLTELHRRDPEGVSKWLRHSPRAASGPDRFLHTRGDG